MFWSAYISLSPAWRNWYPILTGEVRKITVSSICLHKVLREIFSFFTVLSSIPDNCFIVFTNWSSLSTCFKQDSTISSIFSSLNLPKGMKTLRVSWYPFIIARGELISWVTAPRMIFSFSIILHIFLLLCSNSCLIASNSAHSLPISSVLSYRIWKSRHWADIFLEPSSKSSKGTFILFP